MLGSWCCPLFWFWGDAQPETRVLTLQWTQLITPIASGGRWHHRNAERKDFHRELPPWGQTFLSLPEGLVNPQPTQAPTRSCQFSPRPSIR